MSHPAGAVLPFMPYHQGADGQATRRVAPGGFRIASPPHGVYTGHGTQNLSFVRPPRLRAAEMQKCGARIKQTNREVALSQYPFSSQLAPADPDSPLEAVIPGRLEWAAATSKRAGKTNEATIPGRGMEPVAGVVVSSENV